MSTVSFVTGSLRGDARCLDADVGRMYAGAPAAPLRAEPPLPGVGKNFGRAGCFFSGVLKKLTGDGVGAMCSNLLADVFGHVELVFHVWGNAIPALQLIG